MNRRVAEFLNVTPLYTQIIQINQSLVVSKGSNSVKETLILLLKIMFVLSGSQEFSPAELKWKLSPCSRWICFAVQCVYRPKHPEAKMFCIKQKQWWWVRRSGDDGFNHRLDEALDMAAPWGGGTSGRLWIFHLYNFITAAWKQAWLILFTDWLIDQGVIADESFIYHLSHPPTLFSPNLRPSSSSFFKVASMKLLPRGGTLCSETGPILDTKNK